MSAPTLTARVDERTDGTLHVRSPAIGLWSDPPRPGAWVGGGARIGSLTVLNRRFALILPGDVHGCVGGSLSSDRVVRVEYGQVLFEVRPVEAGERVSEGAERTREDLPDGGWAVVAPTDGFFYRRSSPETEPFVEVGSRVRVGQTLGLVEVMKTFNQIAYGGEGLPDEAEIVEIRVGDGAEVGAGQVLMVVR